MSLFAAALADIIANAHSSIARTSSLVASRASSPYESDQDDASTSSLKDAAPRPNEHLAVLLPKNLWKPDSLSSQCDNFYCNARFSVRARRHHCRKCGGIFCRQCTSRTTALLDVSNLDFLHPPRNVPITTFESSVSPVTMERVCDDCWDQVHGCNSPRTPELAPSTPTSSKLSLSSEPSSPSSICSSVPELPDSARTIRVMRSSSQLSVKRGIFPSAVVSAELENAEPSYGELDSYPLRRASIICKATGGGRWEPKNSPPKIGIRIPGVKAQYEIEMEREEQEQRTRQLNPVVRDGDFQYRFPRNEVASSIANGPLRLSTF
ncbi:hypothetical protein CONPUDRAFT_133756 [Coniophora puteana RWD-64-598 SS2]|uniref:FYVE-type domain-containing protein n=1 Tax=Coniophora puteana (strain RWD-64-598) TaxID=741705 RepID=A0A5M3N5D4_CONPW|nr:uncharacterized protein CONPUDRAFT_133756 [Coniophora puteana RWD-64-598 SS2]EIW86274.1 hypothetical protein CONPUDRAFT_133756 [Coniophora puteana RWD-64-598 SS2]